MAYPLRRDRQHDPTLTSAVLFHLQLAQSESYQHPRNVRGTQVPERAWRA